MKPVARGYREQLNNALKIQLSFMQQTADKLLNSKCLQSFRNVWLWHFHRGKMGPKTKIGTSSGYKTSYSPGDSEYKPSPQALTLPYLTVYHMIIIKQQHGCRCRGGVCVPRCFGGSGCRGAELQGSAGALRWGTAWLCLPVTNFTALWQLLGNVQCQPGYRPVAKCPQHIW